MQYNSITSPEARGAKASYSYNRINEGYKEWLDIIGYSKDTVNSLPNQLKPFFFHLKKEGVNNLQEVPKQTIKNYYQALKQKKSQHTGELLKNSTLNGHLRNLRLFNDYLEETGQGSLLIDIKNEPKEQPERDVLALHEVDQLYSACSENLNGLRERAILSLYYGCGLRCKEGINLNVNDILLDKQLVHIRRGKNRKARYVPFVEGQQKDFELYLRHCRPSLLRNLNETSFLVNNQGKRTSGTTLSKTLKTLVERTGNEQLQQKKIGLHTLRHGIATHLLQSGMEIWAISQFLGHSGIRSTQTYLHLVNSL